MKQIYRHLARTAAALALTGLLVSPTVAEPETSEGSQVAQRRQKTLLGNRLDEFARIIGQSDQQVRLLHDLDGNGTRDQIFLVELFKAPTEGIVVDALGSDETPTPGRGTRALAVVLNPGSNARYFVFVSHDGFPLDGPSWDTDDFTGFVSIGYGPEPPKDAKGKSIVIVTESGAGWYIHWNGTRFIDSSQGDMP